MNAFNWQMGAELAHVLGQCDEDDGVRAVVLTGAGRAFCAGADLAGGDTTFRIPESTGKDKKSKKDRKKKDKKGKKKRKAGPGTNTFRAFQVRKPVIAAINGHAIGVGLTMTTLCDIRLVAEDAKLAFAFVRRGVVPELASHAIVPRIVGFSNAADLLLSGRTFSGREAAHLGLASRALPADKVLPAALELARDIARNTAPVSVALAKRLLWEGITASVPEMLAKEMPIFAWAAHQADAVEGVRSFVEKREPAWELRVSQDMPD
jgi:enoyl-CoA hydratase/carnithine racemase